MFGLFKKKELGRGEKMGALIKKQTTFSVNGLELHKKLISAAVDKNKAYFEAFLFNNWVSLYLITRELCAAVPSSDVKAVRDNIEQMLIISAQKYGVPALEQKLFMNVSDYCEGDFPGYAKLSFWSYDSSVERHQTPAWLSAAIRLSVCAGIPQRDVTDLEMSVEDYFEIQKESVPIFQGLEGWIRDDVQDYLRTK